MGFFNKIKKVFSGSGATIRILPSKQIYRGNEVVHFVVECTTTDKDVDSDGIYAKIQAVETVSLRGRNRSNAGSHQVRLKDKVHTYETTVQVHGPIHIPAHGVYEWEGSFEIPPFVNGTYMGKNAKHEWSIYAAMEVTGLNPNSGWTVIEIYK